MAKWIDSRDGYMGLWFSSLEDISLTKEEFNKVFDYLLAKYADKPNRPILTKLAIKKFDEKEYKGMDN